MDFSARWLATVIEGLASAMRTSGVWVTQTLVLWLMAAICISGYPLKQCFLGTPLPPGLALIGQQRRSRASVMVSTAVEEKVGVANQHSSLLALLTIALAARVDRILLPPTLSRSDWTDSADWREGPSSDLWDRKSIEDFVKPGGVQLQEEHSDMYDKFVMNCSLFSEHQHKYTDIADAAYTLNQYILDTLAHMPGLQTRYRVHVVIPTRLAFTLRTANSRLYRDAMHSISFSSHIHSTADVVLQALQQHGSDFNAVHLRMEGDYADLLMGFGQNSFESEASTYLDALKEHGCDDSVPTYVGSGIFAQEPAQTASDLDKKVIDWLRGPAWKEVSSIVLNKEQLIPHASLEHMTSEQLAAVDILVLVRSRLFFGHSISSMSWLVQELRALAGIPREASFILGNYHEYVSVYRETYSAIDL